MKLKKILFLCVLLSCLSCLFSHSDSLYQTTETDLQHLKQMYKMLLENYNFIKQGLILLSKNPEKNQKLLRIYELEVENLTREKDQLLQNLNDQSMYYETQIQNLENLEKLVKKEYDALKKDLQELETELESWKNQLKKLNRRLWIERIIAGLISGVCFYLGFKAGQNF